MAGTIVYVDIELDLPKGLAHELGRLGFRLQHTANLDEALALVRDGAASLAQLPMKLARLGRSYISGRFTRSAAPRRRR